jgi:hypothetical protein
MALRRTLLLAMLAMLALPARAQFIGYTSSQTTSQTVFTSQAANAVSPTMANIGQAAHYLTICNTSFVGTVSLEASGDGTFAAPNTVASGNYALSVGPGDSGCHTLQAGGYFPAVRVRVSNYSTGSVSAWYTGIASPISFAPAALNTQGQASPIACDLESGPNSYLQSAIASAQIGITGLRIYVCSITISFSTGTTAGVLSFGSSSGSCAAYSAVYSLNITANTPQILHLVGGPGGLFRLLPGQQLCVSSGAITASALVNISYAQF